MISEESKQQKRPADLYQILQYKSDRLAVITSGRPGCGTDRRAFRGPELGKGRGTCVGTRRDARVGDRICSEESEQVGLGD